MELSIDQIQTALAAAGFDFALVHTGGGVEVLFKDFNDITLGVDTETVCVYTRRAISDGHAELVGVHHEGSDVVDIVKTLSKVWISSDYKSVV